MTHEVVSVICSGSNLTSHIDRIIDNTGNYFAPCVAYEKLLRTSTPDIIIYIHDDVTIHDSNWLERVIDCFDVPMYPSENTVAVGLGGATQLGNGNLYRKPYNIMNMARYGYASNQTDAEVHGARFTGVRKVAVLDAFFMAVRRDWLLSIGGWPVRYLTHHCLDTWLACEAARAGKEIWMVGASCTHHGGGSSTKDTYRDAKWLQGGSRELDHRLPHKWIYENYGDVLPIII